MESSSDSLKKLISIIKIVKIVTNYYEKDLEVGF